MLGVGLVGGKDGKGGRGIGHLRGILILVHDRGKKR